MSSIFLIRGANCIATHFVSFSFHPIRIPLVIEVITNYPQRLSNENDLFVMNHLNLIWRSISQVLALFALCWLDEFAKIYVFHPTSMLYDAREIRTSEAQLLRLKSQRSTV